jgi:hypothetical protein
MKLIQLIFLAHTSMVAISGIAQKQSSNLLSQDDLSFLEGMTRDMLEASRIYPEQFISNEFGSNRTGGTLIRPGGRGAYPSFWVRDYAMSLETGLVSQEEQLHMIRLTAATQADQARITKGGSLIPYGAIADHIRIDTGEPIYFPGTYSVEEQGTKEWGVLPPYCDQFYFVHMVHAYVKQFGDYSLLMQEVAGIRLIDRLKTSFHVSPSDRGNHLVHATEALRGVDFGFRDAQFITGDLCFTSILKYRAATELA